MSLPQENYGTANGGWPRILLMEDEPSVAKGLLLALEEEGYGVDLAMTGQRALDSFDREAFDLLVADIRLPDMNGMDVIRQVKETHPETEVIVITGYSTVPSAVTAMKLGAFDYMPKPFSDDEFRSAVTGALKSKRKPTTGRSYKIVENGDRKETKTNGLMGTALQNRPRILLMEDEPSVAEGLKMILEEKGYHVDWSETGQGALDRFRHEDFDLLVADLRMPDIDGMEVIKQVKKKRPETEIIVITGYSTVPSAVAAMKIGAFDYLPKPFTEEAFSGVVDGALKEKKVAILKEISNFFETKEGKLIQKREVVRVLERTSHDYLFWRDLLEKGSIALEGYHLSSRAKAAIVSGDLKWLREHIGDLTQNQLRFIHKRLEREAWS